MGIPGTHFAPLAQVAGAPVHRVQVVARQVHHAAQAQANHKGHKAHLVAPGVSVVYGLLDEGEKGGGGGEKEGRGVSGRGVA